jgi:hypothetical protein
MTMNKLQRIAMTIAGICALAGTGFVAAFAIGGDPQGRLLAAAVAVAAASAVSLLASVLAVFFSRSQAGSHPVQGQ